MFRIPTITAALILAFASGTASADAIPFPSPTPAVTKMQNMGGAIMLEFAKKKGLSPTDPRTYQTLLGASKALAQEAGLVRAGVVAGTAVVAASSAPGWASILASIAISVGVSYALPIALDSSWKFMFGPGSTPVTVINPDPTKPTYDYRPSSDAAYNTCSYTVINDYCLSAAYAANPTPGGRQLAQHEIQPLTCLQPGAYNPTLNCTADYGKTASTTDQAMQQAGLYKKNMEPVNTSPPQTMESAVGSIPANIKAMPVSPEALSFLFEGVLKKAAADPAYQGLPYDKASFPTPEEIKALAPYLAEPPTVGDFVAPQPDPATSFSPAIPGPSGSTGSTPGSSEGTSPVPINPTAPATPPDAIGAPEGSTKVDLGPDPAIGAPRLENTPTVPEILDPLFNMMPSFKSFAVPAHNAVCPKPSFDLFGKHIVMEAHCTLIEANRTSIFGFMLAVYGITSVFIILKA